MATANITDATVSILLEVDGQVHIVAMEKDSYDAIQMLAKTAVTTAYRTERSQRELHEFLGVTKGGINR